MHWVAPSERDTASDTLEKRLWDAADQFRANSGLTAAQYSAPVLGLIFLRFAEARFAKRRAGLEKAGATARRGTSRLDDPTAYHAEGVIFLTPNAHFDHLLQLPEGGNIGQAINEAMADIEKHNPQLAGVLPRTYQIFTSTLLKELLKKVSEIPVSLDYDAFGRIYEYFLGQFARTEGSKGGEFYTPSSIVRLIVEIIEPFHGLILDPACGSGGMFVQSAGFVQEHKKNPSSELAICGVEKTDETGRLCRMNLAIHGLEGTIRHGGNINTYYDDPHEAVGKFDFVLAKPNRHYEFLFNAVKRAEFVEALNAMIREAPFQLVAAVIRKLEFAKHYALPVNPYGLAMEFGLERIYRELEARGQGNKLTHIVVEKRGYNEDDQLELAFRRICDGANALRQRLPFQLVMTPKAANSAGLQLADLLARPVGIKVLRPDQPNRAYDILEGKFRRSPAGKIEGWGLKIFP